MSSQFAAPILNTGVSGAYTDNAVYANDGLNEMNEMTLMRDEEAKEKSRAITHRVADRITDTTGRVRKYMRDHRGVRIAAYVGAVFIVVGALYWAMVSRRK